MQVVDVLAAEKQMAASLPQSCFKARQGAVGSIRLGLDQISTTQVVECVNLIRFSAERLWGRQLHRVEACPQTILVAEGPEAALGGYTCSGEYKDLHPMSEGSMLT
jgi:hypothetical protein